MKLRGSTILASLVLAAMMACLPASAQERRRPPPTCPSGFSLEKIKTAQDLATLSARDASAVFGCHTFSTDERAALAVYRAKAKPLGPRRTFDEWFVSADMTVDTFTLFNGAESYFSDQPANVRAGWDSLKVKLTEIFSNRRLALTYVDEARATLSLHWDTFTSELKAAGGFLDLENSTFTANLNVTAEADKGFGATLSKVLTGGAALADKPELKLAATAMKSLSLVIGLIDLIAELNAPEPTGPIGRVDDSRTGRDELRITLANLQLNYQADFDASLQALDKLKTYIVRDRELMEQLAGFEADAITGVKPSTLVAPGSKTAVRRHLVETLLPIRGVLYGTDITRYMAATFVSEPWRAIGSDTPAIYADQNYLTYRLARRFPVGYEWYLGGRYTQRKGFCPDKPTSQDLSWTVGPSIAAVSLSTSYIDQPCPDVLAYSGFIVNTTFGPGDGIPEGEFQQWRLAFGGGGKGEIPRLATEGKSSVDGFSSPWDWITSVMSPHEVWELLRTLDGRMLIQQVRYDCNPNPRTGAVCVSEGVSPSVRDLDPTGYDVVPLPKWDSRESAFWKDVPGVSTWSATGVVTNSAGYWPPAKDKRFRFDMFRYTSGAATQEVCYGENGVGRTCRTWQRGAIIPTSWVVLVDPSAIPPPPPGPPPPPFLVYGELRNTAGQCLEVDPYKQVGQGNAGRRVTTGPCDGRAAQRWWKQTRDASQIRILLDGQEWCLDAAVGNPFSPGQREILAWSCKPMVEQNVARNQLWTVEPDGVISVSIGLPRFRLLLTGAAAGNDVVGIPEDLRAPTQRWQANPPAPR